MRKWIGGVLLVGLVLALSSCSKSVATTEDVQRIDPSEAKALLDDDEAVLYDVRSTEAYETKHAVGAISLPEPKVSGRLDELPDDKTLIFY